MPVSLDAKDIALLSIGAGLGLVVSLVANILTGPILGALTSYWVVRAFASVGPFRDRGFDGTWEVSWSSTSERFASANVDKVRIYSFWFWLAFEATFPSEGEPIKYRFVGRNRGRVISGRWFDPRSNDGYHGHFQVIRSGDLRSASGAWLGFSSHEGVEAQPMGWSKMPIVPDKRRATVLA